MLRGIVLCVEGESMDVYVDAVERWNYIFCFAASNTNASHTNDDVKKHSFAQSSKTMMWWFPKLFSLEGALC